MSAGAAAARGEQKHLVASIDELGLLPRVLTFEIIEHDRVGDVNALVAAAREVQATKSRSLPTVSAATGARVSRVGPRSIDPRKPLRQRPCPVRRSRKIPRMASG